MRQIEVRCSADKRRCRKLLATVTVGSMEIDAPGQPDFEKDAEGHLVGGIWPRPICPKHGRRARVDLLHLVQNDVYKGEEPLTVSLV